MLQLVAAALQSGMTFMFWVIAAIGYVAFATSLAFPRLLVSTFADQEAAERGGSNRRAIVPEEQDGVTTATRS